MLFIYLKRKEKLSLRTNEFCTNMVGFVELRTEQKTSQHAKQERSLLN